MLYSYRSLNGYFLVNHQHLKRASLRSSRSRKASQRWPALWLVFPQTSHHISNRREASHKLSTRGRHFSLLTLNRLPVDWLDSICDYGAILIPFHPPSLLFSVFDLHFICKIRPRTLNWKGRRNLRLWVQHPAGLVSQHHTPPLRSSVPVPLPMSPQCWFCSWAVTPLQLEVHCESTG